MSDVSDLRVSADQAARQARRLGFWARVVLVPVAVIGAVLSFRSLYQAAVPTFGDYLAAGFPLLVDLLILGASLQYVAGAKIGRPMGGWRLTAHAGVAGTLVLNALAAKELGEVPWHVTAPAVWAVLVELTAKQVLGEWKATHTARADTISLPLWITAPFESVRTRLLMFRTGITNAHQARIAVGVNAAAREALRLALPKRNARRVRKIINRQLRAGSLTPVAILRPLGWTRGGVILNNARPDVILQAVLQEVLDPGAPPAQVAPEVAPVAQPVVSTPPVQRAQPVDPAEGEQLPELDPELDFDPEFEPEFESEFAPAAAHPTAQYPANGRLPVTEQFPATEQYPVNEQYPVTAQYPAGEQPVMAPPPGVTHQGATQPVAAGLRPGTVQQPARALQLGRALHRGRVLQQTGTPDSSATTAEQLRMQLAREQAPRMEPEQADETAGLFQAFEQPQQPQEQVRQPQPQPQPQEQVRQPQQVRRPQPQQVRQPQPQQPVTAASGRVEPARPDHRVEQAMHAERQAERLRAERPVEPFRQQTAVFDPAVSRPSDGRRPTPARFDESEILDDVDHLDELDGQEYPAGFDGLERGDYIDLDDPARTYHADPTVTVPR